MSTVPGPVAVRHPPELRDRRREAHHRAGHPASRREPAKTGPRRRTFPEARDQIEVRAEGPTFAVVDQQVDFAAHRRAGEVHRRDEVRARAGPVEVQVFEVDARDVVIAACVAERIRDREGAAEGDRARALLDRARSIAARLVPPSRFKTTFCNATWLAADDLAEARRHVDDARAAWSVPGFQLQHYWIMLAEGMLELYANRGRAAWTLMTERWSALARSQLLRVAIIRAQMVHLRAAAILATATETEDPRERRALVRAAERDARALSKRSSSAS